MGCNPCMLTTTVPTRQPLRTAGPAKNGLCRELEQARLRALILVAALLQVQVLAQVLHGFLCCRRVASLQRL